MEPSAFHQHSQAVILKVAIPIGSPLDELHLSVEAFRDSIVLDESPHADDGCKPCSDCAPNFLHFSRRLVSQQSHHFLEFAKVDSALPDVLCFQSQ